MADETHPAVVGEGKGEDGHVLQKEDALGHGEAPPPLQTAHLRQSLIL